MDVIVTFSFETYHDAVVRGFMRPPDRLIRALERDTEVRRLLVADDIRSIASVAAGRVRGRVARASATRRYVQPWQVRRRPSSDPAAVRDDYARAGAQLHRAAVRHGMGSAPVVTFNPFVAAFGGLATHHVVTYYGRDDWLSHPSHAARHVAHELAREQISVSGTRVVAVSQLLMDRLEPQGPHAVVPNGITASEWRGPAPSPAPDRPVISYAGSLDSRIDVEVVRALGLALPEADLVFAGPVMDGGALEALGLPNLHLPGHLDRASVVRLLRTSALCVLPHRSTALTLAMSPLKVYEYLAAGRPVVATDLPPVRDISPHVTLVDAADGPSSFVGAVRVALARGPMPEPERQSFLDANDWAVRHRTVLRLAGALTEPAMGT